MILNDSYHNIWLVTPHRNITSYIYYKSNKYRRKISGVMRQITALKQMQRQICVFLKSMRTYAADRSGLHYGSHLEVSISSVHAVTPHIFFHPRLFLSWKRPSVYVERKLAYAAFDKPSLEAILCPHFHRNSPFVPPIIVKNAISCQSSDECGNGCNIKVSGIDSCISTDALQTEHLNQCMLLILWFVLVLNSESRSTGRESQMDWNRAVILSSSSRGRCQPSIHAADALHQNCILNTISGLFTLLYLCVCAFCLLLTSHWFIRIKPSRDAWQKLCLLG